ncbi:type II secretion system F family protein [Zhongshania sp.]|uniref:type II secretion system F family protein n=1 Tax=Zhongshania sp. TaxID=1971902 RepID=UPI003564C5E1
MVSGSSPAQRFVLFQALYQASQSGENNWDQVVALLSKGQRTAQRAQLDELAEQFASGQRIVLDELREGGMFTPWELQFMQLGLAVGNLAKIYLRLAEHYRLQTEFRRNLRRHLWAPVLVLVVCALGLPLLALSRGLTTMPHAVWLAIAGLLPLGVVYGLWQAAQYSAWFRRSCVGVAYRLPALGSALTQYQNYHYMNHLADCISADFTLPQALKQSARRLPDAPVNSRYFKLASEVEAGGKFSSALLNSGILEGVTMPPVSEMRDAKQVPALLGLAIHRVCEEQLVFWAAWLPWLLLGVLPFIVVLNAWFLGQ